MWKIYKHLVVEDVFLVHEDGTEDKIRSRSCSDLGDAFYTVEDRESDPPKMVTRSPDIAKPRRYTDFHDAVKMCAILNSGG
jgi:hypothetical protein